MSRVSSPAPRMRTRAPPPPRARPLGDLHRGHELIVMVPARFSRRCATPRDEAVDEDAAAPDQVGHGDPLDDDPGAVVMRQEDVVVRRQEPDRGRHVRVHKQPVLHVEQFPARLVAEDPKAGTQALDDLAQAGQPRPDPHVGHGRRPERSEVPQDHLVGRRVVPSGLPSRPARSSLLAQPSCPIAPAAAPGRWEAGTATRTRGSWGRDRATAPRALWPAGLSSVAPPRRARAPRRGDPRGRRRPGPSRTDRSSRRAPTRPGGPAAGRGSPGRHQVQRGSQRATPDGPSLLDEGAQLLRVEPLDPAPQREDGSGGSWACMPTRCSMTDSAGRSTRSSRSWRPRSVRLSARRLSTGAPSLVCFAIEPDPTGARRRMCGCRQRARPAPRGTGSARHARIRTNARSCPRDPSSGARSGRTRTPRCRSASGSASPSPARRGRPPR